jgi:hypothetical protein
MRPHPEAVARLVRRSSLSSEGGSAALEGSSALVLISTSESESDFHGAAG